MTKLNGQIKSTKSINQKMTILNLECSYGALGTHGFYLIAAQLSFC